MKLNLIGLLCLCALSSCGTMQVATRVVKQYPVTTAPKDVVVYENGAPAPADAEILGDVMVYDNGGAKTEPWDTTLFRAKKAVSRVGGNGLYIMEHLRPSFTNGSNHQISGTMMLCHEGSEATADNPFTKTYKNIEEREINKFKGHSIRVSAGYGRIISDIDMGGVSEVSGNLKNGIASEVGYEYIFPTGLGLGVTGSMFQSSAEMAVSRMDPVLLSLDLKSVMATVSMVSSTDKFIYNYRLGLGYGMATQKLPLSGVYDTEGGRASNVSVDFSYRFNPRSSLGADIGLKSMIIRNTGEGNMYGYRTLDLGLIFNCCF